MIGYKIAGWTGTITGILGLLGSLEEPDAYAIVGCFLFTVLGICILTLLGKIESKA